DPATGQDGPAVTARRTQSKAIAARADARQREFAFLAGLTGCLLLALAGGLDLILRLIGP
ncbi:MAG: hypothetical protein RLY86_3974, partial [Pseudomonadota bacterium]